MAEEDRGGQAGLIVYADYVCPYCALAEAALAQLRAEGTAIEARAFELWPVPQPLPDLERPYFTDAWDRRVMPLARAFGVEGLQRPRFAARTRKAHEAALFARDKGVGEQMRAALYRAYFEQARDIGRIDVLVEVGAEIGLNRTEMKAALDVDKYTESVASAAADAVALGINAVPAYLVGEHGAPRLVVGMRSADELRALLGVDAAACVKGDME